MKLKLTLHREAGPVDLAVTADATATVADVAARLLAGDPTRRSTAPSNATLHILDASAPQGSRPLAPQTTVAEAGLLSGMHVRVAPAAAPEPTGDTGSRAVARLRVLSGPDAGQEFPLPAGATVVGRDRDVGVRLTDPMISKRHARINVSNTIEIIDLGSANGIRVSGDLVTRAVVSARDTISLGDSELAVVQLQKVTHAAVTQIDHIRSPRVVAPYPGEEFEAPGLPQRPQLQRLPYLALVAPLLMGVVMWALTQQVLGVIMMAMSPLLLLGAFVDQRITQRRTLKAERETFAAELAGLRAKLETARAQERAARLAELPTCAQLQQDALRLGPLLWTERPESSTFLILHAGSGRDLSRNSIAAATDPRGLPESRAELDGLREEFAHIDDVPVTIPLREGGALGVAGSAGAAVARSLMYQLVARHAPSEVVVAALVSSDRRPDWQWLSWLPHTGSTHSPIPAGSLADSRSAGVQLLSTLEGLIDERVENGPVPRGVITEEATGGEEPANITPVVIVLVEHGAPVDRARLTRIVERGPDAGIHVLWCAPHRDQLPAACRSYIEVDESGTTGSIVQVRRGATTAPVSLEVLEVATAEYLARQLAPVVDVGVPDADDSDLPRAVSLPALLGSEVLDQPDAVVERWRQNASIIPRAPDSPVTRGREGDLRAVFGHAGSEPFALDLRADGPHALVGGTTGAGKSEFLQSWVLAMATAHSPDRLTFLFVDYKGGSAFAACTDLPHSVGLVTDLSPAMVRRALTSLRAELRYREHLLNAAGAKDLVTLEKRGDANCPPSLIIIVDEFAALVQEVPEFVDGVVDVAQRGRSLGLHLVLATQRPNGVIKDNLRANTNLRIALRMADAEDSADILGDKMAAYFDPSVPGRGAVKRGPGRITAFQTGYAGGRTTNEPPEPRIDVEELDFGSHTVWEAPALAAAPAPAGEHDITRIVRTVVEASEAAGIPRPRRPWLDELAEIYRFELLPNPRTDELLPIGVVDDPAAQAQPTTHYRPDEDGNLAIFGAGGSGKSTALRTIAVAAGVTSRHGGPTHVYGLDFGARGLSMLARLPHVGAIVQGDDEERVIRMLRMLRDIVDERAARYAAVNAGTIGQYRQLADARQEPRILLLVDGIGAFKEQYEFGPAHLSTWYTAFAQIAADGRAVGVHVVLTAERPSALPTSIASTVQRRIVLRLANDDEYLALGVPRDVLGVGSPPGRGMLDGDEVQLAVLGESSNVAVQAREIERFAATLRRSGDPRPAGVARLADSVALADLPVGSAESPVIGLDDVSLAAASFASRGVMMIAGPPGSGRTTALSTFASAVRRADPALPVIWLTSRRSPASARGWSETADSPDDVLALCGRLIDEIESGRRCAVFIEAVPEFTETPAEYELVRLIKTASRADLLVVGEGSPPRGRRRTTSPSRSARRGVGCCWHREIPTATRFSA
ncbi:FtsK/SpoIIIE domain-containing protein [Microbacterium suwonense]|uniref:Cell division protein FtsK n=1 Tax=Microbacterium suwonense TaxID=683047 RepID=A0ABM8FVT0_9MICO|nr:cell division protein FtsK [Microbacterium suwonense]